MVLRDLVERLGDVGDMETVAAMRRSGELLREQSDGGRANVADAALVPIVRKTLRDVAAVLASHRVVVFGGLAYGAHAARPRATTDVDVFAADEGELERFADAAVSTDVFRRSRGHALVHRDVGVEVELVSPAHVGMHPAVAGFVVSTAGRHVVAGHSVLVAGVAGVIASKLGRAADRSNPMSGQDQTDIRLLMRRHGRPDLSAVLPHLSGAERGVLDELIGLEFGDGR